MRTTLAAVIGVVAMACGGACGTDEDRLSAGRGGAGLERGMPGPPVASTAAAAPFTLPRVAEARIEGRSGARIGGRATFTELEKGVRVEVEIEGAAPGRHGLHVHENGDCSAADASSAGDHFNPDGSRHGAPTDREHHAGDLGNIVVGIDGRGRLEFEAEDITVAPGARSIVGRAIIVHEREDDFSQPAGNAGARVGCGVIKLTQ